MIIGLNGRMRSGKDTTANILSGLFENVERVGFADKLKDSGAAALLESHEIS
jgi:dephospho-CoA kinase